MAIGWAYLGSIQRVFFNPMSKVHDIPNGLGQYPPLESMYVLGLGDVNSTAIPFLPVGAPLRTFKKTPLLKQ